VNSVKGFSRSIVPTVDEAAGVGLWLFGSMRKTILLGLVILCVSSSCKKSTQTTIEDVDADLRDASIKIEEIDRSVDALKKSVEEIKSSNQDLESKVRDLDDRVTALERRR
jgi:peptidoglycan hydrolase CwlO-like protein